MWRLFGATAALFVLGVYAGFVLPVSGTVSAVQGENTYSYPYLSSVSYTQLPQANSVPTVAASIIENPTALDARFAGMLLHVRWLLERKGGTSVEAELNRLDKQILSVMDDVGDDIDDLREDIGEAGGLPSGFVVDNSGTVTAGVWQGTPILDAYINDVLTLGSGSTFANNIVTPNSVLSSGQVDEYCLTYESTGTTFEWELCGGGVGLTSTDIDTSSEIAAILSDETGTGALVFANSPILVSPNLGTPSTLVGTNITGTAAGLTAGTVTTNANLTGAITSVGNTTSLGSFTSSNLLTALTDETGTGSAVFSASPTFTGTLNAAAATLSSALTMSGSAANINLGSNYLSGDGDDEGIFVDGSGNVGIGTGTLNSVYALSVNRTSVTADGSDGGGIGTFLTINPSADTIGGEHLAGYAGASSQAGNTFSLDYVSGFIGEVVHNGLSTLAVASGNGGQVQNTSIGTIGDASSVYAYLANQDAAGTITNVKMLDVLDLTNAGTIGNTYGLYVGDITSGTQTNQPYSIYASDSNALNYLAGNVGIGTTSPYAKLSVTGNSAFTGQLNLSGSAANIALGANYLSGDGGDEGIYVDSNGNVGIGTTTPGSRKLLIDGSTGVYARLDANLSSSADGSAIWEMVNDSGALGQIGMIRSGVAAPFGNNFIIRSTTSGSDISFAAGSAAAVHMILKSGGNLGLGTTTPGALLDIQGSAQFGTGNVDLITSAGKITGLSSTYFGTDTSANLATILTDELGTGNVVYSSTLSGYSTSFSTSAGLAALLSDETGTGSAVFGTSPTFTTSANFGTAGVRLSDDGDGALTFLGMGDGFDESLTLNLDDAGDEASFTSSTGVNLLSFTGISPNTDVGYSMYGVKMFYASSTNDSIAFGENAGATFTGDSFFNIAIGFDAARFASTSNAQSIFIGREAGYNNSGSQNHMLGWAAGYNNSGNFNNFFGLEAGYGNIGSTNNLVGLGAGYNNTGDRNNLLGFNAGYSNDGSTNNIFGEEAGYVNTGTNNNIFGSSAGYSNTGSSNNIFGVGAGANNSGISNNIFGSNAGSNNSGEGNNIFGLDTGTNNTGNYNNFIGRQAGYVNTGDFNEMMGYLAGYYLQSTSSIAIGAEALFGSHATNFISLNNVALGYRAGYASENGSGQNIFLGYQAGDNLTTGNNNIIIGYDIDNVTATADNRLNIGNLIFGTGLDGTGTTTASGNVGIGTTTPFAKFSVTNTGLGPSFLVEDDASPDASPFVISSTGDVGIGISSPNAKLTVHGGINLSLAGSGISLNGDTVFHSPGSVSFAVGHGAAGGASGSNSTYFGFESGYYSTGELNNLIGSEVAYNNTGSRNNFMGSEAGRYNTGDLNVFIGNQTGIYLQSTSTVAVGAQALYGSHATTYASLNNVALGYRAGYASDDGSGNNILIGYQAADNLTTGNNNIIIGYNIDNVTATADNSLNIGNLIFGTGLDGTGTTLSSGNVGIGTTSPYAKLSVTGNSAFTGTANFLGDIDVSGIAYLGGSSYISSNGSFRSVSGSVSQPAYGFENDTDTGFYTPGSGAIRFSSNNSDVFSIANGGNVGIGTTTPLQKLQVFGDVRVGTTGSNGCIEDYGGGVIGGTCSSDERLKENIESLASSTPRSYLEALTSLTPVTYTWNQDAAQRYGKSMNVANLGLIAQDVENAFPELVSRNDDNFRQVDFRALPFYIIEAMKELWTKVRGIDERVQDLEEENEYLKSRLDEIEDELNVTPPPVPTPEPEPTPEENPTPEPAPEPPPEPPAQ